MFGKTRVLFASLLLAVSLAWGSAAFAEVNINTADEVTLATELNGVGEAKAAAIVAYREAHGPFKSVDDLANVSGIGEATLAKNRDRIVIE